MSNAPENKGEAGLFREIGKGLGVLALLIALMLWLAGGFISKVHPGPPSSKPPPGKFVTQKVARVVFPVVIDQMGSVSAQFEAQVSSRIMAQVKEILVNEGDFVEGDTGATASGKNTPASTSDQSSPHMQVPGLRGSSRPPAILARLDERDIRARLAQAQQQVSAMDRGMEAAKARMGAAKAQQGAALASKEKVVSDYRRYEDLHNNQAATGQQLMHAKTQRDVAEAQVVAARQDVLAAQSEMERILAQKEQAEAAAAEARVMLSYAVIRAPFSGRIVKKMVRVGDMAAPGQPLFLMDSPSFPELHSFLTESLVPHLRVGQEIEVYIDALKRTFSGTLRELAPKSDPSTRTVLVKVALPPESDIVNGLFGRLRVACGTYASLVVPLKAVREEGQLHLADVLGPDGHPQRHFITVGKIHGELVEVLSGLNENEDVIIP